MNEDLRKNANTDLDAPDYSSYIAGWKRRQQLEKAEIEKRRAHARQIALQAVEILEQHGATKVILFGSVLDHTSSWIRISIWPLRCHVQRGGSGFSSSVRF